MANVAPGFFFYVRDFLADTVHMSTEEVGAYWLILCAAWDAEVCGHLDNDHAFLASVARLNAKKWERCSKAIMRALKVTDDGLHVYSKRMVEVFNEQEVRRQQASDAGRRSAAARAQQRSNGNPTTVERPLNDRINETTTPTPTESNSAYSDSVASAKLSQSPPRARNEKSLWERATGNLMASGLSEMYQFLREAAVTAGEDPTAYAEAHVLGFVAWAKSCPTDRRPQLAPHKLVANFAAVQEWVRGERKPETKLSKPPNRPRDVDDVMPYKDGGS